jgi:hypothetical protein
MRARRSARQCDEHNQLPTERPLIDDDGDGVGREARARAPTDRWRSALQAAGELLTARGAAARQAALEAQVEALKARRSSMTPDAAGRARTPAARTCAISCGAAVQNPKEQSVKLFTSWTKSLRARCGAGADDLLRLLRNVYFQQESTGSADVEHGGRAGDLGQPLGLIESTRLAGSG